MTRPVQSLRQTANEQMNEQPSATTNYLNSFGRKIKDITSQVAHSLPKFGKVTVICGLVVMILFLPCFASAAIPASVPLRCQGTQCQQVTTFEPYLQRFMNNGMQLVSNGTAACDIETPLESEDACQRAVSDSYPLLEKKGLFKFEEKKLASNFEEKGTDFTLMSGNVRKTLSFGINPEKYASYQHALQYVEKTIIAKGQPFQGSIEETVTIIRDIHYELTKYLPDTIMTPGRYRPIWLFVDYKQRTPIQLLENAKKSLPSNEYEIFLKSFDKLNQLDKVGLTRTEQRIWNKIMYIPPRPDQIEKEMNTTARYLKSLMLTNKDTEEKAAEVHIEIARISPFADGNGRIARILMNCVLVLGGMDPVIFDNNIEYSIAVDKSVRDPKDHSFLTYLREHVIPWTQAQKNALTDTSGAKTWLLEGSSLFDENNYSCMA